MKNTSEPTFVFFIHFLLTRISKIRLWYLVSYIRAHYAAHAINTSFANRQEREAFIGIAYLILPMATVTGARRLTGAGQGIYKGIYGKKNLLAEIKDRGIPVPDDGVPFQRMNMQRLANILVDDDAARSSFLWLGPWTWTSMERHRVPWSSPSTTRFYGTVFAPPTSQIH